MLSAPSLCARQFPAAQLQHGTHSLTICAFEDFLTTHEASWYIISVVHVCISVCLSVSLSDDNFESLAVFIFAHPVLISGGNARLVRIWRSSGQGQGHSSNKGPKSLLPQCKTAIGNNSSSSWWQCTQLQQVEGSRSVLQCIKHRAAHFARSMGFSVTAKRMVWPPFFVTWLEVTARSKCGHSRVVLP